MGGKVAVFTSALDIAQTETKGTVLIKNADEMLNFTTGEEKHLEKVSLGIRIYFARPNNSIQPLTAYRYLKKLRTQVSK
jgi:hypothetical protein